MDIALVGPGRAGTAVALAAVAAGHHVVSVAGRTPDAESTRVASEWIRDNMPDLAASPPMVSSGTVTLSA